MSDIRALMENARLARRLTQRQVATELGISQPHYSKVMGGVVPLATALERKVVTWLDAASTVAPDIDTRTGDGRAYALMHSIQRQIRELASLLAVPGAARPRRRTRHRKANGAN